MSPERSVQSFPVRKRNATCTGRREKILHGVASIFYRINQKREMSHVYPSSIRYRCGQNIIVSCTFKQVIIWISQTGCAHVFCPLVAMVNKSESIGTKWHIHAKIAKRKFHKISLLVAVKLGVLGVLPGNSGFRASASWFVISATIAERLDLTKDLLERKFGPKSNIAAG